MSKKYKKVRTKTILQIEATECGAACLAMILRYYGKQVTLEDVRQKVGVSRDGSRAGNIMRACKDYQLEVHGYRREPEGLWELDPPCIIHWNFNHFVVYEGRDDKHVYINDPAVGRRVVSLVELDDSFTGVVLTFKPLPGFTKTKLPDPMITALLDNVRQNPGECAALVLTGFMLCVPGIVLAFSSQIFIDYILSRVASRWFPSLMFFMSAAVLYKILFSLLRFRVLNRFRSKIQLLGDYTLLRHMFRLPMSFFDRRHAGDVANRLDSNASAGRFLSGEFTDVIISIAESVLFLVFMLRYSPLLTLIVVGVAGAELLLLCLGAKKLKLASVSVGINRSRLTGALYAGIGNADSLKASGSENAYTEKVLGEYANVAGSEQAMAGTQQILSSMPKSVEMILNVLILLIGSIQAVDGTLSVGDIIAFSAFFSLFMEPVTTLMGFFMKIRTVASDLLRVMDIRDYAEEDKYTLSDPGPRRLPGSIVLRDVVFGYCSLNPPEVEHFDLNVMPGQMIALVGSSGSGKSTIAKVISGLYKPWSGEVTLGGVSIHDLPEGTMHKTVSMVSQNICIFSGTIRDNITLWDSNIPDAEIMRAARDACMHDFITTCDGGYESLLDENGKNLSGGQRQRLEIARALVSDPSLLILDEATSALDPITEKQVLDNIRARGCTCVMVAHRLSAIRDCNEIIVMEKGRIVERGTHEQLMETGTYYPGLIRLD